MTSPEETPCIYPRDEYRFHNFQPHSEEPITASTFDELDRSIEHVNQALGITPNEPFYAFSEGQAGLPSISARKHEGPEGLIVLSISFINRDEEVSVMARNDAGTLQQPEQPAASETTFSKDDIVLDEIDSMSETEFGRLNEIIKQRKFKKKKVVPVILARA
jgi:hypothetical protein